MPFIRIPEKSWGLVWRFLIHTGPISRITSDHIYAITDRQLRLLRKKKLPFEVIPAMNGNQRRTKNA